MSERIAQLAQQLYATNEERRLLADKAEMLKSLIYTNMVEENVGELTVAAGEYGYELKVKNNLRFNTAFDKDGLSDKVGVDRRELTYEGVSALVENGQASAELVGQFQSSNRSQFVTVRKRPIPKSKKKKS